jgi:hypothetical protein
MTNAAAIAAAPAGANYDEALVGAAPLPDPLVAADGSRVDTADGWRTRRRDEILRLFETEVYGSAPPPPAAMVTIVTGRDAPAFGGLGVRREVALTVAPDAPPIRLLIYLPAARKGPAPAVLGMNFLGNHTVAGDPGIRLADIDLAGMDIRRPETPTGEGSRGSQADRWQVETTLRRGYALATFWYGDAYPDRLDGEKDSIRPAVDPAQAFGWGALAIWAWAMSRALDVLLAMPEIDARRVVLFGHSRHGKAALWAGAQDERFALVISNNSGCGGASLSRRNFGETLDHITRRFPHWFAAPFPAYAGHEDRLPVDQHMLLALIAPRPLYVASAEDDLWADPKGEFLSALAADPVYRLLGTDGLPAKVQPPVNEAVMGTIGYHIRSGGHGVTAYDWDRYLDFADRHFGRAK